VIASACPFCLSTLEDAVLTSGLEGSLEVMDIAEIVAKAL
jgi:Fe-S oxidoreductase